MNFPVFDFHCDTALALLGEDLNQAGSLRKNKLHIDLERASQLGGYAQCFACFTTPMMEDWYHISPVVISLIVFIPASDSTLCVCAFNPCT